MLDIDTLSFVPGRFALIISYLSERGASFMMTRSILSVFRMPVNPYNRCNCWLNLSFLLRDPSK